MKLLIVDDDTMVLESCRRILAQEGYDVTLTSSAKEALEILSDRRFELMLVDVIMPEYDGIYLMGTVREEWPHMPVIVMSGYPTPEVMARGKHAGAFYFIAKPFDPDELLEAIHAAGESIENQGEHDGSDESTRN